MIYDRNIAPDAAINASKIAGTFSAAKTYYVDRNVGASGNGGTWETAFKTFKEAVTQVNNDYTNTALPSNGRNRRIIVGEGWYGETPTTLTANDVHIVSVAPGTHDPVVIYGSATAGGFDIGASGPALFVSGSNVTLENIGFFTYDNTHPALQIGSATGDYGGAVVSNTGVKIINCSTVRDVADGSIGGILVACAEGPEIIGCRFSTSNMDYGIKIKSNGVINPVGVWMKDCKFIGTPIGVDKDAGSDCIVEHCLFIDDTTDRSDVVDYPITNEGNQLIVIDNYSEKSIANLITGNGDHLNINNYVLAKT